MNSCKKCHVFLHDYLDQNIQKRGVLAEVANAQRIKEQKHELIKEILCCQSALTDWVLQNTKGEVEMRTSLIKKPETKDEEYLLTYYILKQVGIGFREKVKGMEELAIWADMIKLKRQDKTYRQKDQFLANLFVPLMNLLNEIHKEHLGIPIQAYSTGDVDDLYT